VDDDGIDVETSFVRAMRQGQDVGVVTAGNG
jgi:hypothetical protein